MYCRLAISEHGTEKGKSLPARDCARGEVKERRVRSGGEQWR
jgi:hypothetical protein